MVKIKYPIIVEGKYDKAFLKSFLDAVIITTEGFGVYKNKDFSNLVSSLSKCKKVIVLTDSDNAGKQIRNYIKNILKDIEIINIFTPQIKGKEKRKTAFSKEGFLGVEGQKKEIILDLLKDVIDEAPPNSNPITKNDLYFLGLCGGDNSAALRKKLLGSMNLPLNLSTNMLLEVLNRKFSKEEFINYIKEK